MPPSGQMKQRQPWKTFFFCQPAGGSSVLGVTHPFLQRRMIGGEKPAKGRVTCMDIKKRFCYVLVKQSFWWHEQQHGGCRHDGTVPERVGPGQGEWHDTQSEAKDYFLHNFWLYNYRSVHRLSRSLSVAELSARTGSRKSLPSMLNKTVTWTSHLESVR